MIGIEGQYLLEFSLGNRKDFISSGSLKYFKVIESCGHTLPKWEIKFETSDNELPRYFHEGNVLTVSFGPNRNQMKTTQLMIVAKEIKPKGSNALVYEAAGFYALPAYINTPHVRTLGPCSGVEVLNAINDRYFDLDSGNLKSSHEKQVWLQPSISDKKFLDDIWLHSYLQNSFVGTGITLAGSYRVRDMVKLMGGEYTHKFTPSPQGKRDISYMHATFPSESGFINNWHGYGKEWAFNMLESGNRLIHKPKAQTQLSMSNKPTRAYEATKRPSMPTLVTRNHHANHTVAYGNNLMGLSLLSSENILVTYDQVFDDMSVLDLVMFVDTKANSSHMADTYSGLYVVESVARVINEKSFYTTASIVRECMSGIKGEVR